MPRKRVPVDGAHQPSRAGRPRAVRDIEQIEREIDAFRANGDTWRTLEGLARRNALDAELRGSRRLHERLLKLAVLDAVDFVVSRRSSDDPIEARCQAVRDYVELATVLGRERSPLMTDALVGDALDAWRNPRGQNAGRRRLADGTIIVVHKMDAVSALLASVGVAASPQSLAVLRSDAGPPPSFGNELPGDEKKLR